MLELRPDHATIVRNILGTEIPQASVWCFGSRARGDHRETSDLDLLLQAPDAISIQNLGRVQQLFEASYLPFPVDLVDWHRIDASFRQAIESQRIEVLQAKLWANDERFEPWHAKPLAECVTFVTGSDPSHRHPPSEDSIPWVHPRDLTSLQIANSAEHVSPDTQGSELRRAPAGAVMLQIRGHALSRHLPVSMTRCEVAFSRDLRALIPRDGVQGPFLAQALNQYGSALAPLVQISAAGVPQLNVQALQAFPVPMPSPHEQDLLINFLEHLDEVPDKDLLKKEHRVWVGAFSELASSPQEEDIRQALRSHLIRGDLRLLAEGLALAS